MKVNMPTRKRKKGFTIIEVVLVLAIAGLIFLMVFVALPALQMNQRNTQRKNDMARIMTAITQYQAHNSGKNPFLPITGNHLDASAELSANAMQRFTTFIIRYIDPECTSVTHPKRTFFIPVGCGTGFTDPDGTIYGIDARADTQTGNKKKEKIKFLDRNSKNVGLTGASEMTHLFVVFSKAKCSTDEGWVEWTNNDNDLGIWYPLEGGSVYCVDNQ